VIDDLLRPEALFWIIPLILLFLFLLFKDFIRDDFRDKKEKKRFRRTIMITRIIIIVCLVIALAKPFGEIMVSSSGNPKVTLLVDESVSMQILNKEFIPELEKSLEKSVPVTIKQIGFDTQSNLGDNILSNLEKNTNLLLITDGNINDGVELDDVALFAANLNSTISAVILEEKEKEAGVYIKGVDTAVSGVKNNFEINIINLGKQKVHLKVSVDKEIVIDEMTKENSHLLELEFKEGTHKIIAEVSAAEDYFSNNNKFYKSVSVVKKPKILIIRKDSSPSEKIFKELYDVTFSKSIPDNADDYYAIIIYDMPANIKGVDKLANYLIDKEGDYYGNGLFVIGGFDSFDRGDYKNSILETYLPVYVGKAARKRGSSNIAIGIDFSGSSGGRYEVIKDENGKVIGLNKVDSNVQSIEKALAISVIDALGIDNNVGVSIFSTKSATVQELSPLFRNKEALIDKISRIQQPAGQSYFHIGLSGTYNLLKDNIGSNNIIFMTDGNTGSSLIRQQTLDTAKTINARGVKIYVVGTGRNIDETFLKNVAYNGGGIYFSADEKNKLRILFGEPEESKFGELFDLFIMNPYHFITKDLELDASLYGFNQVIPKNSAQLLVTTQHGEPAVTVWTYGLGRVATLNVFSGNNNLGDLLNKQNSVLLTRIINWVIGNPQRKEQYYVAIPDARIDEYVNVIVKSSQYPNVDGLSFSKEGEDKYSSRLKIGKAGFNDILGNSYAVNYKTEYQSLGMNPRLEEIISMSRGKMFKTTDNDKIVEFIKKASKKNRIERTTIIWPFLLCAIIIYLLEIFLRKIREKNIND